ncbi:MLO-like protein 8 [Abeliophyllum distichum]|uniref:MLO-like protein n=1 Tax=Abeliophyllum distichum TaxID=126358 RepID=A0ABD1QHR0_9LAMI
MAGESGGDSATLERTPTWAVATICFFLIAVSILIEHALHLLAKYLSKKRRKYLIQALNKIKSDLLLLGFISLLLTVCEKPIANICIPKGVSHSFLPCQSLTSEEEPEESKCEEQEKVSLMSRVGVQQLQMLIFFLAFFHVLSIFLTFSLGTAKMGRWKHWEAETRTFEYQFSNGFGSGSSLFSSYSLMHLVKCQTLNSNIWILNNLLIVLTGISCHLDAVFRNYFWLPFIPLVMLLVVGAKLQGIITKMCLDSSDKSHVIRGTLLVQPSDHFFWFDRPKLLLHLMHFILFQNSFQLAFFSWSWYKFGLRSCFHRKTEDIIIKLAVGVVVNFLCGYVTLPLYALITQMGSSMRNAVFPEEVMGGLKRWQAKAKKNLARKHKMDLARRSLDGLLDTSVESSPSFGTLDASFSVEIGYASDDGIVLDEDGVVRRQPEQQQKLGSFGGFELSRTQQ